MLKRLMPSKSYLSHILQILHYPFLNATNYIDVLISYNNYRRLVNC